MLADIRALAYEAAQVWNAKGDEADGAADANGACHKAHYGKKEPGFVTVWNFYFFLEMTGKPAGLPKGHSKADSKQS